MPGRDSLDDGEVLEKRDVVVSCSLRYVGISGGRFFVQFLAGAGNA